MQINKEDIKKYLPHREPFLFIDEVVSIKDDNEIHFSVQNLNFSELFELVTLMGDGYYQTETENTKINSEVMNLIDEYKSLNF